MVSSVHTIFERFLLINWPYQSTDNLRIPVSSDHSNRKFVTFIPTQLNIFKKFIQFKGFNCHLISRIQGSVTIINLIVNLLRRIDSKDKIVGTGAIVR